MESPQIITKVYDLLLYLIPQAAKFPKNQRYLLGERLETQVLDILDLLLEARYSREKYPLLRRANIRLEQCRFYLRLGKDLRFLGLKPYEVLSKMVNDVGVQLGGWIKQSQQKS